VIVPGRSVQFRRSACLEFRDILPEDAKLYDKMRPPKKDGMATKVHFHVTVMGLDSIDENAMVTERNETTRAFVASLFTGRNAFLFQTYAADIFFAQTWKDHRLRLPENMTSEYRFVRRRRVNVVRIVEGGGGVGRVGSKGWTNGPRPIP